jgi:hypothetical protein
MPYYDDEPQIQGSPEGDDDRMTAGERILWIAAILLMIVGLTWLGREFL